MVICDILIHLSTPVQRNFCPCHYITTNRIETYVFNEKTDK